MMPLLGSKLHVLNPIWKKKKVRDEDKDIQEVEKEPDFLVSETHEMCTSEEEFQRKTAIYAGSIWTCRVTGKSNMTYREASKSEASSHRILKKNFPNFFSKPILERVHLSTHPLDHLVHLCWVGLHEQFHPSESVKLKVDSVSKHPIHGIIEGVDKSVIAEPVSIITDNISSPKDPNVSSASTTSPNSSDKENTVTIKKTAPVKKNYTYAVKVVADVPLVVNDIPACSIERINKVPSKELIRMFIRAHAMRYGPNFSGPWIVDAEMLRRYKISTKSKSCEVDKVKLKQLSNATEMEYLARMIKNERLQNSTDGNTEDSKSEKTLSLPTTKPFFKRTKHFSVLREGNAGPTPEDDLPLSIFKRKNYKKMAQPCTEDLIKKKMKQATLFQFRKLPEKQTSSPKATSSKRNSSSSAPPPLPRIAQHLVQLYTEKPDSTLIASAISMCAKMLSDAEIARLPNELREKVAVRKEAIDYRKKLLTMTPTQRKAFLQEQRTKQRLERMSANRLCDDQELLDASDRCLALPQPSQLHLPSFMTKHQFGRLLGLSEFLHCFQVFLVEGVDELEVDAQGDVILPRSTFPLTPLDSAVPCPGDSGFSEDDDQIQTDEEEEEVALIEASAPLPKISVRCFQRLGLTRLMRAISTECPTAGAYRSLARPICLLLRLLLKDEELAKRRELGLRLVKLPVTPYTAPELLRLALLEQHSRLESSHHSSDTKLDEHLKPDPGLPTSLSTQLGLQDIYELCPENRLQVLEAAVDRLFDLDLIDEHILACQRRAQHALNKKLKAIKDRNMRRKEQKEEGQQKLGTSDTTANKDHQDGVDAKSENQTNEQQPQEEEETECLDEDLASIVKRRRVLAARAAAEREERRKKREEEEALERERRAVQAHESAEERALAQLVRAYEVHAAEARCALRCQPIGLDRFHRRIWYFRCAPDRLFVESDWATSCIDYCVPGAEENFVPEENGLSSNPKLHECETTLPPPAHCSDLSVTTGTNWSSWAVYDRPEQLDQLFNALLERGIRESQLKRRLTANGLLDSIRARWSKFPTPQSTDTKPGNLLPTVADAFESNAARRASNISDQVSDKRAMNAEAALAGALLKNLLDTEVRLRSGGLGGVPDFAKWQEQLAEVHTSFGLPASPSKKKSESIMCTGIKSNRAGLVSALISVADNIMPRFLNVPNLSAQKKPAPSNGQVDSLKREDLPEPKADPSHSPSIDEEDSDSSDSSSSVTDQVLKDPDQHAARTQLWLDRWRNEVRSARTLTRLNLLHACLDACIRWEKSVEDARCRICRHKSDDDNLLLCDGCNRAFHLYCLRPPLKRVPAGDWFCPCCRPATKDLERRRRQERLARSERRRRNDSASEEEHSNGSSDSDSDDGNNAGDRRRARQPSRHNSLKRPRQSLRDDDHPKLGFKHDATCLVCDTASSDLIRCTHCPSVFHLACHNPPLRHQPRGDGWQCTSCRLSARTRSSRTVKPPSKDKRRALYQSHCVPSRSSHEASSFCDYSGARRRSSLIRKSDLSTSRRIVSSSAEQSDEEPESTGTQNHQVRTSRSRRSTAMSTTPSQPRPAKRRRLEYSSSSDSEQSESAAEAESDDQSESQSDNHRAHATRVVNAIMKHRNAWPFREPVDKNEVPDYYEIVTNPIDLTMIRDRLDQGRYDDPQQGLQTLVHDLGVMFYNAELYNAADSDVWVAGSNLEQFVKNQFTLLHLGVSYSRPALGEL